MSARWGKFFLRAITFPFLRCCFIFQWEQDTVTEKKGKRKIDIRNFVAHNLCKRRTIYYWVRHRGSQQQVAWFTSDRVSLDRTSHSRASEPEDLQHGVRLESSGTLDLFPVRGFDSRQFSDQEEHSHLVWGETSTNFGNLITPNFISGFCTKRLLVVFGGASATHTHNCNIVKLTLPDVKNHLLGFEPKAIVS